MRPPVPSEEDGFRGIAQRSLSATPTRIRLENKTDHMNNNGFIKNNNKKKPLNGNNEQRCQCCLYGFHIDLGFVNFAEDVFSGKEQYQVKGC